IPVEYHDFLPTVFSKQWADRLAEHSDWDFRIKLTADAKLPEPAKIIPMTEGEKTDLKRWIEEMLAKGFIQPSKSPMPAACFFVKKKDGSRRLVVDWRKLNEITVKD
ncbi:DNA/RNA polymerase, partial [Serendipita vermifera]